MCKDIDSAKLRHPLWELSPLFFTNYITFWRKLYLEQLWWIFKCLSGCLRMPDGVTLFFYYSWLNSYLDKHNWCLTTRSGGEYCCVFWVHLATINQSGDWSDKWSLMDFKIVFPSCNCPRPPPGWLHLWKPWSFVIFGGFSLHDWSVRKNDYFQLTQTWSNWTRRRRQETLMPTMMTTSFLRCH